MGATPPGDPPGGSPPPPGPPPPPASWPAPAPTEQASSRGFPWKVLAAVAAVILFGAVALAVLAVDFVDSGRLTAHIDRANDYLEATRTDRSAAVAMLCPGAQDPNIEVLSAATGQYLTEFDVTTDRGTVTGSVAFPDGSTRPIRIATSGPVFPSGEDPAVEVCIRSTSLP